MPSGIDLDDFNPNNPATQIALLAMRIDNLGKEKEALERALEHECEDRERLELRVAAMEKSFQRGAGILMVLPIVGGMIGFIAAYWRAIFAPWSKP